MNSRRAGLLLAVPAALVLAACSSATSGTGHVATPGAGSRGGGGTSGFPSSGVNSAPGSGASSGGGGTATLSALLPRMQAALKSVTSAHLEMDISAAGTSFTGVGDEQLSDGRLVALNMTMQLPQIGAMQMILVGTKAYLKLPSALSTSDKPYTLVSKDSSNPTIRAMAGSLDSTLSNASLSNYTAMMTAAKSFKVVGPATVAGVAATQYSMVLDPSKLPSDLPGRDTIIGSGISELPMDIYLDSQNRVVGVTEHLTVGGQSADTKVTVTDYNKPVTITAPPADQVSTG